MTAILYTEVNVLCIAFLLLIYVKMKRSPYIQTENLFLGLVLLSNCLLFATDVLWIFVDNRSLSVGIPVNWVINAIYYILSGAVSYLWFMYSEQVQGSRLASDKRYTRLCALPMLLLMGLTLVSVKTGWLFYIDSANIYHRGPLYSLQLFFSYGYIIFTALKALVISIHAVNYADKRKYRTLASFVIPTLLAGFIQVFFPGIPTLCIGTTFGILYVFLTLQERLVSVDSLTGLNNRNKMMQQLSDRLAHSSTDKRLYLLMMDLDYFKQINDSYGHVEGDNALRRTADVLKQCVNMEHSFIARYGGDEFVLLCELNADEQIEDVCQSIHLAMRIEAAECPYRLTLSIGCAEYHPDIKTEQDFIRLADAELYKVKQSR